MSDGNRFTELYKIDCSGTIEKKGRLSYLSWVWAWKHLMEAYPDSYSTVYEDQNGRPYFDDGRTAWVKTGVTLVDGEYRKENIEYLPIMNERNRSIPVKDVTSFEVNKAIQRSVTKAIARHGIGLYIYAGEDLPENGDPNDAQGNSDTMGKPDANSPKESPKESAPIPAKLTELHKCTSCGGVVTNLTGKDDQIRRTADQVAAYTKSVAGEVLCWTCFQQRQSGDA